MSKTIAYARVSTDKQETDNQLQYIAEYAMHQKLFIDDIVTVVASTRKGKNHRLIDETINKLGDRDILLVYSLDRLGRSTLETLQVIEDIKNKGIKLILIKDNITIDKHNTNPMNDMLLTILSAFAQLERSFISERTKAGLARVKANGTKLGRKKGQQVRSIYDSYKQEIIKSLDLGVTQKNIHKDIKVGTVQSLGKYIKSRGLKNIKNLRTTTDGTITVDYQLRIVNVTDKKYQYLVDKHMYNIQKSLDELIAHNSSVELSKDIPIEVYERALYELRVGKEERITISIETDLHNEYNQLMFQKTNELKRGELNFDFAK